ncbi:NAD(P)H-binding protein [Crossiella sp. SN42]|uniref:NAD(P)H-binding protein n=1 Tax=Crossiella sp. SN42 TaxID=2944808 RepID=UPI00207CBFB2|nr:NAD(P)H-binding protein [Crossiella sp. SN42]MCO1577042.1 NAD(P)H-binding protein [Crossiella sp. SN42]
MTILVTGATGSVGRHVVDGLLARGEQVRATTRDPGQANLPGAADVRQADINDPDTFLPALEGVAKLYLFPHFARLEYFLGKVKEAGVRRIVTLSSSSTVQRLRTNKEAGDEHLRVEQAVEDTGLEWTHLRPGMFAGNTAEWAESIKLEGLAYGAYPQAAMAPIHERDIAEVGIAALLEDGHVYARYSLTGPETHTRVELVRIIGEVLGRELKFREQTPAEAVAFCRTLGYPDDVITMIEGYRAEASRRPDEVTDTVERVLGRPALSYRQWVQDHADWFQ